MKDKKNIICIAIFAVWLVLGIILMIRVPMAQVSDAEIGGLSLPDAILSYCFCTIALFCAPFGYFIGKKSMIGLGFANLALAALSLLCFILFVLTSNGLMVGYGLMLLNPYCALFAMRGIGAVIGLSVFAVICFVLPILFSLLFKFKPFKRK